MMKYGEKFGNNFRKGAQILAFSKRNFFFRSPFNDSKNLERESLIGSIEPCPEGEIENLY